MSTPVMAPTALITALASQCEAVAKAEQGLAQRTMAALREFNHAKADEFFRLTLAWNALHRTIDTLLRLATDDTVLTYVVTSWFLQDLLMYLTPQENEEATYVTGPIVSNTRILSRICAFELDEQSVICARGNAISCSDTLIEMDEHGNRLHLLAHSHPGSGPDATRQSDVDIAYMRSIQCAGADTIGAIFTRDGHVRFFSVEKAFRVHVQGKGVDQLDENLYKIVLPKQDKARDGEGFATARRFLAGCL